MRRPILLASLASLLAVGAAGCEDENSSQSATSADASGDTAPAPSTETADSGTRTNEGPDSEKEKAATTGKSGVLSEQPPLEVSSLLTAEDLAEVTDRSGFDSVDLPGREPSGDYNDLRLAPRQGDGYGAGMQLWTFAGASGAKSTFLDLRGQYLNTGDPPKAASDYAARGFLSERAGVRHFVFQIGSPPRIAAVSCSAGLCSDDETLVELGSRVASRLREGDESGSGSATGAKTGSDDSSSSEGEAESPPGSDDGAEAE